MSRFPDFDALAEWLGAMDESRNVFDMTGEATTVINIDVEVLAERLHQALALDRAALARVRALADAPIPQPPAFAQDHWTPEEVESWEEGALKLKSLLGAALYECRADA